MRTNLFFENAGAALALMLFLLSGAAWGGMDGRADWPDHAGARAANLALVPLLNPSPVQPPDVLAQPTSIEHPFSYAYFRVLGASPSVDGRISDLHPPTLFWAWGEKHSPHETYSQVGECSISEWEIGQNGSAWLNGTMTWSLDGRDYAQRIENGSMNPLAMNVPAAAWANLTVRRAADGLPVLPNLTMSFEGVVGVQYHHREKVENSGGGHDQGGITNIHSCGPGEEKIEQRNYTIPVRFNRTYGIESGEPLLALLQPADLEQMRYAPRLETAALLARRPRREWMGAGDHTWAQANFSQYYAQKDEFNFTNIRRLPADGDSTQYATSGDGVQAFANSTYAYLRPEALDEQNRSFAWQYYMLVKTDEEALPAGSANATLVIEDDFGDGWSRLWVIRTRQGCGIGGLAADDASVRCVGGGAPPVLETGAGGADGGEGGAGPESAVLLWIGGDDARRPAQKEFVAQTPLPDGWLLSVPLVGVLVLLGLVLRCD